MDFQIVTMTKMLKIVVTMKYNYDQMSWLFEWSSVLFPSIMYLHDKAKLDRTLIVKYRPASGKL